MRNPSGPEGNGRPWRVPRRPVLPSGSRSRCRARLGDLPKLAHHLLVRIAEERGESVKELAGDAVDLLRRHRWPGNIRELENALHAASLFADGGLITGADLKNNVDELRALAQTDSGWAPPRDAPSEGGSSIPPGSGANDDDTDGSTHGESGATETAYAQVRRGAASLSAMKRQIERECIARALSETNGNITHAAALLGLKRPRLSQLVKQYGLSTTVEVKK